MKFHENILQLRITENISICVFQHEIVTNIFIRLFLGFFFSFYFVFLLLQQMNQYINVLNDQFSQLNECNLNEFKNLSMKCNLIFGNLWYCVFWFFFAVKRCSHWISRQIETVIECNLSIVGCSQLRHCLRLCLLGREMTSIGPRMIFKILTILIKYTRHMCTLTNFPLFW